MVCWNVKVGRAGGWIWWSIAANIDGCSGWTATPSAHDIFTELEIHYRRCLNARRLPRIAEAFRRPLLISFLTKWMPLTQDVREAGQFSFHDCCSIVEWMRSISTHRVEQISSSGLSPGLKLGERRLFDCQETMRFTLSVRIWLGLARFHMNGHDDLTLLECQQTRKYGPESSMHDSSNVQNVDNCEFSLFMVKTAFSWSPLCVL